METPRVRIKNSDGKYLFFTIDEVKGNLPSWEADKFAQFVNKDAAIEVCGSLMDGGFFKPGESFSVEQEHIHEEDAAYEALVVPEIRSEESIAAAEVARPAVMNWDDWAEKYKPTQSGREEINGWMYETFGDDDAKVKETDERLVWTMFDDGETITNGKWWVNRLCHFICEVPWEGDRGTIDVNDKEAKRTKKKKNKKVKKISATPADVIKNVAESLHDFVWSELAKEGITKEDVEMVDLDIAFSPVIPCFNDNAYEVIETHGRNYLIKNHPVFTQPVSPEELKVMRYRYLTSK